MTGVSGARSTSGADGVSDSLPRSDTPLVRWQYRAADATGASVSGEIDAVSERAAVDALRRRSLWVTALSTSGARGSSSMERRSDSRLSPWAVALPRQIASLWTPRASARDIAAVTRAMATLLAAGVPLDRTLSYAVDQAPGEQARASFVAVRDAVRSGVSLSTAVRAHDLFPAHFAPTLAAGEASGTLGASLLLLADHLERSDAVRRRLQAALIYPAILGVASIVGVTVILLVVVPRFADLIMESGGALPLSTRLLIGVSGVIGRWWWLLLSGVAAAVAGWSRASQDPAFRRRWHATLLSWPVIGQLERTRAAAAYTGTLAVALKSGVPLLAGMTLSRATVANLALNAELAVAEGRVRDGGTLSGALDGVLPPLAVRLLDAGETGGNLSELASRAAQTAEADIELAVGRAVTVVEPLLILGFGGLVGFVALALLQAIYGINASTL